MGLFGGGKGGTTITKVEDPIKTAVSNPLSQFLANNVGKGLPSYTETTGKPLTSSFSPQIEQKMTDFMNMDSNEYFNKSVYEPALKAYKEDVLPELREGYAGNMRGSGRFSSEEDSLNKFSETMATERYKSSLGITEAQLSAADTYKKTKDAEYAQEYTAWYNSLPENNPVLSKALDFLKGDTGVDYVVSQSAKKSNSGLGALAGMAIMGALSLAIPGSGIALAGLTGAQVTGLGGMVGGILGGEL